jgi:[acyl-carrier-protein] S-malonyltransferase
MAIIFMYPGQNSKYPGMFDRLLAMESANRLILSEASGILGRDLKKHYRKDNASQFALNRDVQIAVFLASFMHGESLRRRGVYADYSLGLSLGEYNHLVDIGALSFAEALTLLELRGAAYERAPEGIMKAVFPVEPEEAIQAVNRTAGVASVAMFNTPRQSVLSGECAAVDAAVQWLEEETGAQSALIEARLPMHSPLFRGVGDCFRPALEAVAWRRPEKPYLPNILGCLLPNPRATEFVDCLWRHPWSAVQWRQSVDVLAGLDQNPVFVEAGPGSVLHTMLGRRWISAPRRLTDTPGDLEESMDKLADELSYGRRTVTVTC